MSGHLSPTLTFLRVPRLQIAKNFKRSIYGNHFYFLTCFLFVAILFVMIFLSSNNKTA